MNLTDVATLRALLERHGMRPLKKWGQHFLTAESVVDRILGAIGTAGGVLEIGPGPGVLTARVCALNIPVVAIEIDPIAVSALGESAPSARVLREDVLNVDLQQILLLLPSPRAILSNMPYNITGPLLGKIAELRNDFDHAVLMMQREVGRRILASAGDSERGSLSVWLQSQFTIERICDVQPGAFSPPPNVSSIVLKLTPLTEPLLTTEALKLVKTGFSQPRKTLANNLRSLQLDSLVIKAGLNPLVRPHQLEIADWRILSEAHLHDSIDANSHQE